MLKKILKKVFLSIFVAQAIFMVACATHEERKESLSIVETETDYTKADISSEGIRELTEDVFVSYPAPNYQDGVIYKAIGKNVSAETFFSFFTDTPIEHPSYPGSGYYFLESTGETGNWIPHGNQTIYFTEQGSLYDSCVAVINLFKGDNYIETLEIPDDLQDKIVADTIKDTLSVLEEDSYFYKTYEMPEDLFWEVSNYQSENNLTGAAKTDTGEVEKIFGEYEKFYYVQVFPVVNGIPIMDGFVGDPDKGSLVSGTDISMIIVQDQVVALRYSCAYQVEIESAEKVSLITSEDAENILKKKYEELLYYTPVTYTDLSLVYCPIPHNYNLQNGTSDYYQMTPAWRFRDENGTFLYINAVTGKEM